MVIPGCGGEGQADDVVPGHYGEGQADGAVPGASTWRKSEASVWRRSLVLVWRHTCRTQRREHGGGKHEGRRGGAGIGGCVVGK
jgi:hypothetical protein